MTSSPFTTDERVCVVVVTYKRAELLQLLFTSFLEMTERPGHIVVVDNASGDETPEVVARFAESFGAERVTYALQQQNTGGSGGFSEGVRLALERGAEWIWVMDDDVAVLPDALERLHPWMDRYLVVQGSRLNWNGKPFYWQYDFNTRLGIPNPVADSHFDEGGFKMMNTACFEGGMFHRSVVQKIGLPDPRFFIYWDDTVYGYLASKVTTCALVQDFVLRRTREIRHQAIGRVRNLNGTSDMVRYHIMRNRGYMARYFELYGDLHRIAFAWGTVLTLAKETIRILVVDHSFRSGFSALFRGTRDARRIRRDAFWTPMPPLA